ncbi:MAG: hypothetical protein J0L54_16830 [Chitinophagales bacterium]|nr:hypothetical protein [Chitinophagales bacterium]
MKQKFLMIACLLLIISKCYSQKTYLTLDSLEASFDTVEHTVAIPCQWVSERKLKENGKPFFIDKDSTRLEFSFFKANSLPFFRLIQTDFETVTAYYNWKSIEAKYKDIAFAKVEEDKEKGFAIFKITDASGLYYYLFARNQGVAFSIKIFNKAMPTAAQLDNLRLLYRLNKD